MGSSEHAIPCGLAVTDPGNVWLAGAKLRSVALPTYPALESSLPFQGGSTDGFLTRMVEGTALPKNTNLLSSILLSRVPTSNPFHMPSKALDASEAGLWWSYTPPTNGVLTVRVDRTITNIFDPVLKVYENVRGSVIPVLTNLVNGAATNEIELTVTTGKLYAIAFGTVGAVEAEGVLSVQFSGEANDDFRQRAIIPNTFPVIVTGSNIHATTEIGENGVNPYPWTLGYGHSVWWEWTSPTNQEVRVSAAADGFTAFIQAYTGPDLEHLTAVTSGPWDQIAFEAKAGTTYYLALYGQNDTTGKFSFKIGDPSPPANDRFAAAANLSANGTTSTVSNRFATPELGEPALFDENNGFHSLWWRWTAQAHGYARVTVWSGDFPPGVGLYTGNALADLKIVDRNIRNANYREVRELQFQTSPGQTYVVLANDVLGSIGGPVNVRLEFLPYLIFRESAKTEARGQFHFPAAAGKTWLTGFLFSGILRRKSFSIAIKRWSLKLRRTCFHLTGARSRPTPSPQQRR